MSGAIGPGDWVEHFGASDADEHGPLNHGAVLQVAEAFNTGTPCDECEDQFPLVEYPALQFVGRIAIDPWCACCFRLIYRPKPDAFSELLNMPADAPSKEPVAA